MKSSFQISLQNGTLTPRHGRRLTIQSAPLFQVQNHTLIDMFNESHTDINLFMNCHYVHPNLTYKQNQMSYHAGFLHPRTSPSTDITMDIPRQSMVSSIVDVSDATGPVMEDDQLFYGRLRLKDIVSVTPPRKSYSDTPVISDHHTNK
jgi:hypothetical protein